MSRTAIVSQLADQIRGVTFAKADASSTPAEGLAAVLRAGNIQSGLLDFDDLVYVPERKIQARQKIRRNDIVIAASSGSLSVVGKAARSLSDFDGGFGAFLKVLRPGPEVDPGYFAHFFQTPEYRRRVSSLAAGANINNLRNEHLDDLVIPLPALREQRRIAAILDQTDVLRAKRRQVLAHLDALTQSIFHDMFGDIHEGRWQRLPLGDVVSKIDSGTSPRCEARPATSEEWGVLKLGAVTYGVFQQRENKAFLDAIGSMALNEVRSGDVLMTRKNTRELVGAVALVDEVRPRLLLPDLIFRLYLDVGRLDRRYFQALMMNPQMRPLVRDLSSGSAASMPNISKARLARLVLGVPPLALQSKFASRVERVHGQRVAVQRAAESESELFAALQARAFRGEL